MGKFGEYLAELLKKKRFTKAALARELKLKRQGYIGNVIAGIHTPTLDRVKQIAKILDCMEEETNKLTNFAIDERHTKKTYRIKPLYPDLRNILLGYYLVKNGFLNRREINKKLEVSPFHPIEKSILEKAFSYLRNLDIAPPFEDAIGYFKKLTLEGKKVKLAQAKFKWSYSPSNNTIRYHQLVDTGKEDIEYLYPTSEDRMPKFELIRDVLIRDRFSLQQDKLTKSNNPYGKNIIKEILETSYHPIEKKILDEIFIYLQENNMTRATNQDAFLLNESYDAVNKVKDIVEYWHFDEKKNILTLALRGSEKKELSIKSFSLWHEIRKER